MPSARKRRKRAAAALPPPSGPNNALTFPAFWDLPSEYEINETDLSSTKPRKHWCFLGKIVSGGVFVRLSLEVEDKTGHRLLVAFHTNDRGAAFQHLCIPGHTIAVLHAKQHIFAFSPPGLRLEENAHIKVLPYSLDQVLKASKDLVDQGKGKRCEVCRMADVPLEEQCAGCKSVWYCSKKCQTKGWRAHTEMCSVMRDVQWLTKKNWEGSAHSYQGSPAFGTRSVNTFEETVESSEDSPGAGAVVFLLLLGLFSLLSAFMCPRRR